MTECIKDAFLVERIKKEISSTFPEYKLMIVGKRPQDPSYVYVAIGKRKISATKFGIENYAVWNCYNSINGTLNFFHDNLKEIEALRLFLKGE